jgi:hypothetical protein
MWYQRGQVLMLELAITLDFGMISGNAIQHVLQYIPMCIPIYIQQCMHMFMGAYALMGKNNIHKPDWTEALCLSDTVSSPQVPCPM